jgi:[ribosomal protein S5]-alanine N-acetyltransferase
MTPKIQISCDTLFLRPLSVEDATQGYLSWLSDPEVVRYLEIRFSIPDSTEELARFIGNINSSQDTLLLGIFLRSDDRHIGNIKLGPINPNHSSADIGLIIGERSQWGKGYACSAINLISEYAFSVLRLAKLTAGCYSENRGSLSAFLRAGFVEEGRRIAQYRVDNKRQDGIFLGRVNPDFE